MEDLDGCGKFHQKKTSSNVVLVNMLKVVLVLLQGNHEFSLDTVFSLLSQERERAEREGRNEKNEPTTKRIGRAYS